MKKSVGFIGLGKKGKPIATRILKAGFPLTVYDIAKDPVAELAQLGATPAKSSKQVAEASEFVIIMVRDAAEVREVTFGAEGVKEGIRKGGTVIIMSTIEPTVVRDIAATLNKMGVRTIDAAVTRMANSAVEGSQGFFVGGDEEVIEDCRDILGALGKDNVYFCGDVGTGQVAKAINQYINHSAYLIFREAMVLGVKCGIKPRRLWELMCEGSANSFALEKGWGPKVLQGNFKPTMTMDLVLKDHGIALDMAREAKVPVLMGALAYQLYEIECASGKGKEDCSASVTTLEKLANVVVRG